MQGSVGPFLVRVAPNVLRTTKGWTSTMLDSTTTGRGRVLFPDFLANQGRFRFRRAVVGSSEAETKHDVCHLVVAAKVDVE